MRKHKTLDRRTLMLCTTPKFLCTAPRGECARKPQHLAVHLVNMPLEPIHVCGRRICLRALWVVLIHTSVAQVAAADTEVIFPDARLEAVVRAELRQPNGPLMESALQGLTTLDGRCKGIQSLDGLEHCTNVTTLLLGANSIVELAPLEGLPKLKRVDLSNNLICDLSPLVANTNFGNSFVHQASLSVGGNPLSAEACGTQVPALDARRMDVSRGYACHSATSGCIENVEAFIPDAELKEDLLYSLKQCSGPIYTWQLAQLGWIYIYDPVADLTGIEHCVNAYQLRLKLQPGTDLSPLSSLTKLKYLELTNSHVTDISALANMDELESLYLYNNNIVDISPLSGKQLSTADLRWNKIQNLPSLVGAYIGTLYLGGNEIDDATPLFNASIGNLDLTYNFICDLPLSGTPLAERMYRLYVGGNPLGADFCKYELPALQEVMTVDFGGFACPMEGPPCGNATPVVIPDPNLEKALRKSLNKPDGPLYTTDLARLKSLFGTGVASLEGLEYCMNLRTVSLTLGSFSSLSPLSGATAMTSLTLDENAISDLAPIAGMTDLNTLSLSGNNISSIAAIGGLSKLTTLTLDDNSISNISALVGLTSLQSIDLSGNAITDIGVLSNLLKLSALDLSENAIADIGALSDLPLYELTLDNNLVCDLSPLAANENLGFQTVCICVPDKGACDYSCYDVGDTVSVTGNPLGENACARDIPILEARRAVVDTGTACDGGGAACVSEQADDWLPATVLNEFHALDDNRDGRLSIAELGGIEGLDLNQDGMTSVAELRKASGDQAGPVHAADYNADNVISLSELLRCVQLFNLGSLHCNASQLGQEDGYAPGAGDIDCVPHSIDYAPMDWSISLAELIRLIQLSSDGYHACESGEDGYCVGMV